jgi:hypothetical protein
MVTNFTRRRTKENKSIDKMTSTEIAKVPSITITTIATNNKGSICKICGTSNCVIDLYMANIYENIFRLPYYRSSVIMLPNAGEYIEIDFPTCQVRAYHLGLLCVEYNAKTRTIIRYFTENEDEETILRQGSNDSIIAAIKGIHNDYMNHGKEKQLEDHGIFTNYVGLEYSIPIAPEWEQF